MTNHPTTRNVPAAGTRLALISGGSRGLGLCIGRELAQRGFNLALISRTESELAEAAQTLRADYPGITVEYYPADVSDRTRVQQVVETIEANQGPIEVLFNVAGIIQVGPLENVTEELFDESIGAMLMGPINVTWAVLPHMRRRRRGHIGTVSSIGGAIAVPHLLPYSTAKFGAYGFSEGLTTELRGTGVTATTILPGPMRTGSHERAQYFGQRDREYAWFAPGASIPVVSISSTTAAKRMVEGTLEGKSHVILTPIAKVAMRLHGLSPQLFVKGMSVAAQFFPNASTAADSHQPREGRTIGGLRKSLPMKALTFLGDRVSKKNQEHPERGNRK
ncbi:SDR family oxidoreductase [Rothia sp. LK2588]|uniref:SDR family NAD(P)-dependent oxidoreductase n=1 Tax=Rothia sp. LK2588 TaxID=3114369 RepID=UPI0034D02193